MCDGRRTINELKRDFPGVDFSLVRDNEDTMFEKKETEADVEERGRQFLVWLCGRPEQRIAVVTHSIFLKELLRQFADNVADEDREQIHQSWVNAEMRSIMLCGHRRFESTTRAERDTLDHALSPCVKSQIAEHMHTKRKKVLWNQQNLSV